MTKENNPNVRIVIGKDKMDRIGFTKIFRIPKRIAKIIVAPKLSKCTPERILLSKNAEMAVISKRIIKFIVLGFYDWLFLFKNQT